MVLIKSKKGFTLVETLIAVSITTLIVVMVGLFQSSVFTNDRFARTRLIAIEDARTTLRRFLEETRNLSYGHDGSYPIGLSNNNAFTFYADIDGDSIKERVRYFTATSSNQIVLKKAVLKPAGSPLVYNGVEKVSTLVNDIRNTSQNLFSYYDTSDELLPSNATPSLVRSASLSLVIGVGGVSTSSVSFQTRSTFRNLKDNY